ncbi:uncharacterized protein Dwil_GK21718 [Drosophila willistoni]|uniref:DNA polymerase zeta catalytic subunit n=1 Tax=Drosophila willistoni TaxID=7260 RepID=B4MPK6_DROWI|nr:DNA polymerase zeta catalytic subunit [Drosophila willistoni]EDW74045.1 uncharacterized protein Dwil_GK21718 [Drosophila willistoni]
MANCGAGGGGAIDGIYSIRLVIADFYMEKPIFGLDPCYSELRGKEIKKVPIVRIFGGNSLGQKTCMHIHGVFPYFYIPYDKRDFESLERGILQIAMSLDKAINISLGQGSSMAQHVFKIQLVKGIPFYGYHRREHQYLKIFMFNPRFVRRAANLLQSGAILGKNFCPHESHVPYILQFMIDYNLYGMSYVHIPLEVVKFRRKNEEEVIPYEQVKPQQLLDPMKVKKVACSSLEVDISSNFILNRFQMMVKKSGKGNQTNPGIEAIWNDEQVRRQKMTEKELPALQLPPTQDRPHIEVAESDIFYRTALESKLLTLEQSLISAADQTLADQTHLGTSQLANSSKEQRRTFNLQKLLTNAVYPEECSQDQQQQLMNASCIPNHLSNPSTLISSSSHEEIEASYLDDTLVDEELNIGGVPHEASFREEDLELLEVLQQLEEQNGEQEPNDSPIDLDSSLAPLSQHHQKNIHSGQLKVNEVPVANDNESNSEDDDDDAEASTKGSKHDFSMALDDIDELLLKLTQSQPTMEVQRNESSLNLPQIDGVDDRLQMTPTKHKRSPPKTPKSKSAAKKYAPLPIIFTSSSAKKNSEDNATEPAKKRNNPRLSLQLEPKTPGSQISLRKKLALSEMRRKSCEDSFKEIQMAQEECTTPRRSSRRRNLDKTHIICSLTPRLKNPCLGDIFETADGKKLVEESVDGVKKSASKRSKKCDVETTDKPKPRRSARHQKDTGNPSTETEQSLEKSIPKPVEKKETTRNNKLSSATAAPSPNLQLNDEKIITPALKASKSSSPHPQHTKSQKNRPTIPKEDNTPTKKMSSSEEEMIESDTENDLPKLRKTPNLRRLRQSLCQQSATVCTPTVTPLASPSLSEDCQTPELMRSFYEHSLIINSPSVFSEDMDSSPLITNASNSNCVITPLEHPPTYEEVLQGCRKLDIPEYEFQQPFYSNPADVTKITEVGFLVLHVPGNKLNDLEPFESVLSDQRGGLAAYRRQQLIDIGGPAILQRYRREQEIREYFSTKQKVAIEPVLSAPSRHEAKVWLKAKEMMQQQREHKELIDSPIKIKRQKITMMMRDEEGADAGSGDEVDADMSLTLTPLSQVDKPSRRQSLRRGIKLDFKESEEVQSSQSSDQSVSVRAAQAELDRSSFLQQLEDAQNGQNDLSFGLSHATLDNTFGFKVNLENLQQAKADIECHYLTILTLEVFVVSRGDLQPDPLHDEIRCLFYAIEHSLPQTEAQSLPSKCCGYIMVDSPQDIVPEGFNHGLDRDIEVQVVASEVEAFEALLALCARWDPDIYAGYEIEMSSWGYIIDRAKHLCFNIAPMLSRVPSQKVRDFVDEDREQFTDLDVEMKLCGRILLDVWRLMRSEIALTSYSFENVMYHILHKRCPWHSSRSLSEWFTSPCTRWIVMEYYLERVRGTLTLLDQLDLVGRTSEMAKLIGIQFYEVLSRGSQFRVESMMLRIAKPKNLVPLSPSVQQRAHMRAPEYLALIMEPQSRFYADPVIVLDFQSLYPSMIIGYNYCFSTCLGRVEHLGHSTPFEFGASQLRVSRQLLQQLLDHNLVTISPCGVVFVKREVREGILPRMLSEILDTRQMVKQSMKFYKDSSALQRILHSRQLGLKLMANVTYGYTAANFSGRMPAVEVGDSVVSKGRETLERAIKMVESNEEWKVRVVYGDTDSMFVQVPGRNRAEAFRIGEEIAQAVTDINPQPVKLKLEKVYQPCILQTKKRYVGYMYESADQTEPVYEAKGIETVRRDGCPAVAKMLEKVLRLLFETPDVSRIKQYVCRQFTKLLSGKANLQDLIFAKEFRGLNGYKPTACVPALELTRKWMQRDPRRIPRRGERVPYIIINGPPGVPLIRLVRSPHEVLANEGHKINAIYYITKAIIPPLNRCLLLIGVDCHDWFAQLPRKLLLMPAMSTGNQLVPTAPAGGVGKSTISQYFSTTNCIIDCGGQTKRGICPTCLKQPQRCLATLHDKMARLERSYHLTQQICQACCGRLGNLQCKSLDCPVLYVLEVKRQDLQQITHFRQLIEEHF